jgi:hypothetical protein
MQVDLANGGESEDSTANNDANKDIRQEDGQDENLMRSLEHVSQYKPFQCPVPDCQTRFSRQGELNRHSKKHRPGEHPCTFPDCGKVFYRKNKLREHWEKDHDKDSRPPNLNSSRPRRDPDQDGNSRSKGFPRGEDSGTGGPSSDQSSEGGDSNTSNSSNQGRASDGHNISSRRPGQNYELAENYELAVDLTSATLPTKAPRRPAAGEFSKQAPSFSTPKGKYQILDQNRTESPGATLKDNPMPSSSVSHEESTTSSVSPSPSILSKKESESSASSNNPLDPLQLPGGWSLDERFATMSIQQQNHRLPCLLRYIIGCPVPFENLNASPGIRTASRTMETPVH